MTTPTEVTTTVKTPVELEQEKLNALNIKQRHEFTRLKIDDKLPADATVDDYLLYKAAEKKAEEEFDPAAVVTLIDSGGQKMLHLAYEPLRKHLAHSVLGYHVLGYNTFYSSEDGEARRKAKDEQAMFPLTMFIGEEVTQQFENKPPEQTNDTRTRKAYEHMLKLIEEGRKIVEEEAEAAVKRGSVSFDQLCMVLREGMLIGLYLGPTLVGMKLKRVRARSGFGAAVSYEATVYGYNGAEIVAGTMEGDIRAFKGIRTFRQLGLEIMNEEIVAKLAERGRRHLELSKTPFYGLCAGNITRRSWMGAAQFRAQGRCMIDQVAMKRTDTNYRKWYGGIEPTGTANEDGYDDDDNESIGNEDLTPEVLACMSPYVYGFSFAAKTWGEFLVTDISDITFRDQAWDQLVLDASSKKIVKALVQAESLASGDFIDGKGGGCIFLLHGPPGTGKTLTAEAVAEKLHRPLYMVGIGELGTNVAELEDNLTRILDTAHSWRAVLLIDEADIFLEERADYNIERNAMVGVFLRLLEYYPGILFLTSNRAQHIDEAIKSRLSLMMHYPALGLEDRTQIWKNILARCSDLWELSENDFHALGTCDINGRQVKNVVRVATTLAIQDGRKAVLNDFLDVIERHKAFDTDIKK